MRITKKQLVILSILVSALVTMLIISLASVPNDKVIKEDTRVDIKPKETYDVVDGLIGFFPILIPLISIWVIFLIVRR